MLQQVNLYQPAFRTRKEPVSAIAMLEACGIAIGILGAVYGYELYDLHGVQTASEGRIRTLNQMRETVAALRKTQRREDPGKALDRKIQEAQEELAQRRRLVDLLSGGSFGNTSGFSAQFTALARQHIEGAWLTGVSIGAGGKLVALEGITRAPELVPVYLDRLLKEKSFSGLSFDEMEISRSDQPPGQLTFRVATGKGQP